MCVAVRLHRVPTPFLEQLSTMHLPPACVMPIELASPVRFCIDKGSWAQQLHCRPHRTHPVCVYCSVAGHLDLGQVRVELMGDHNVDQYAYERIVGARQDAITDQVHVAVVWQANTQHPTGGSWGPIENIGNIPIGKAQQRLPTSVDNGNSTLASS